MFIFCVLGVLFWVLFVFLFCCSTFRVIYCFPVPCYVLAAAKRISIRAWHCKRFLVTVMLAFTCSYSCFVPDPFDLYMAFPCHVQCLLWPKWNHYHVLISIRVWHCMRFVVTFTLAFTCSYCHFVSVRFELYTTCLCHVKCLLWINSNLYQACISIRTWDCKRFVVTVTLAFIS